MSKLFGGDGDVSDHEEALQVNNEYAKNYNQWRQKEEYNKLKTKYGEHLDEEEDDSDSSSSDDDVEIPEKLEVDFFQTLCSLKTKDPKIYDSSVNFFDDTPIETKSKKKEKVAKMFLKDYERKMLLESGGIVSDSDNEETENPRARSPTYIEEQYQLKQKLRDVAENIEDDNENEWGGMFKVRSKTKEEEEKEDSEYKQWLTGEKKHLTNEDTERNLQPLKNYWNDPKLDKEERFLRDYILNNRFLDKTNPAHVPTYDEIVHDSDKDFSEDEVNIEKQEEFEVKYNYRYEEPDEDFIKRYPRTMENSLRRTDDKRKVKRAEVKERKLREKEEKFEEIRQLKEFKKKEIEDKIKQLQEVTGNTQVGFDVDDLEADFDPEAHDKRMQKLFDEEYYDGEEGDQKPEFPEIDEELEIERWDNWEKEDEENKNDSNQGENEDFHCEDDDFNMNCEYDPDKSTQEELMDNSRGKKKRKRKSKLAKAISIPKPAFDPNDKTYEEYLDEYYKIDCEDVIGNIPCRFKYRDVVPNSFGLSIDEILSAKDRELNKWCSLKKAVQHRPDHMEKYDVIAYKNKGENEGLKRKILPSLFEQSVPEEDKQEESTGFKENNVNEKVKPTATKRINKTNNLVNTNTVAINKQRTTTIVKNGNISKTQAKKRKIADISAGNSDKLDKSGLNIENASNSELRLESPKKKKPNKSYKSQTNTTVNENSAIPKSIPSNNLSNEPKTSTNSNTESTCTEILESSLVNEDLKQNISAVKKAIKIANIEHKVAKRSKRKLKAKFNKQKAQTKPELGISDARLKAFGLKPKKYKNNVKFGAK